MAVEQRPRWVTSRPNHNFLSYEFQSAFLPMYEKPDLADGHLRGILSVRLLGDLVPLQQRSGES